MLGDKVAQENISLQDDEKRTLSSSFALFGDFHARKKVGFLAWIE
jgi:hypothetical protein